VVLDMAAESGGNVEGSRPGERVAVDGVTVIGAANLPAQLAPAATALYAKNLLTFLGLIVRKGESGPELAIDTGDDLVAGTLLTRDGAVVHPAFVAKD
jgi:NAD(P) transhydrogenase subunit alpha